MKKFLTAFIFCFGSLIFAATAQETAENTETALQSDAAENMPAENIEPQADELIDDTSVKPLETRLSESEKMQEESSDLNYIADETPRPDLLCEDENLFKQIKDFIFASEQEKPTNSVHEKRSRILLVNNLHPFAEVTQDALRGNFEASAALANLRINENREIHRICASYDNQSKKFKDTYVIIYPYLDRYKVVVTNIMLLPEKMDDATFIFKR